MKKLFPYILIAIVFLGSALVPFHVAVNQDGFHVGYNKAEAQQLFNAAITVSEITSGSAKIDVTITTGDKNNWDELNLLSAFDITVADNSDFSPGFVANFFGSQIDKTKLENSTFFTSGGLNDSTPHYVKVEWKKEDGTVGGIIGTKTFTTQGPEGAPPAQSTGTPTGSVEDSLPGCGVFGEESSILGCVAQIIYYFIFMPAAGLMFVGGKFLDIFMFYSLDSGSYRHPFVGEGWSIVRDISNIVFIVILIYVAIKTILNIGGAETKKMIGTIIIVALLINFSLFFTKVIIDTSNILARIFYTNIETIDDTGNETLGEELGQRSIAIGLISQINPQTLLRPDPTLLEGEGVGKRAADFAIVSLAAAFVALVFAYVFFAVGLLFLARVIGLFFAMVLAPFAFASLAMPGLRKIGGIGWDEWWKNLTELAILAPIFTFFLFLIAKFASLGIKLQGAPDNVFDRILFMIVPLIFLVVMILAAKKLATKYAGEFGKAIIKGAKAVGGVALGAAMGGVGMLGRAVMGGGAARVMRGATTAGAPPAAPPGAPAAGLREYPSPTGPPTALPTGEAPMPTLAEIPSGAPPETAPPGAPPVPGAAPIEVPPGAPEATPPAPEIPPEGATIREGAVAVGNLSDGKIKEEIENLENQAGLARNLGDNSLAGKVERDINTLKGEQVRREAVPKKETPAEKAEQKGGIPPPESLKDKAAQDDALGWWNMQKLKAADSLSKSSFDFRNTKLAKFLESQTGMSFGRAQGKGGFLEEQKAKIKKDEKFAKLLEPRGHELKALRTLHNDLRDLRFELKEAGVDTDYQKDAEGNYRLRDDSGKYTIKAPAEHIDQYNQLDQSVATYDKEKKNVNGIYQKRLMNFSKVADKGRGLNYIWGHTGWFGGSAQGLESGEKIRGWAEGVAKGDKVKLKKGKDKVVDAIKQMMREEGETVEEFKKAAA